MRSIASKNEWLHTDRALVKQIYLF